MILGYRISLLVQAQGTQSATHGRQVDGRTADLSRSLYLVHLFQTKLPGYGRLWRKPFFRVCTEQKFGTVKLEGSSHSAKVW